MSDSYGWTSWLIYTTLILDISHVCIQYSYTNVLNISDQIWYHVQYYAVLCSIMYYLWLFVG